MQGVRLVVPVALPAGSYELTARTNNELQGSAELVLGTEEGRPRTVLLR